MELTNYQTYLFSYRVQKSTGNGSMFVCSSTQQSHEYGPSKQHENSKTQHCTHTHNAQLQLLYSHTNSDALILVLHQHNIYLHTQLHTWCWHHHNGLIPRQENLRLASRDKNQYEIQKCSSTQNVAFQARHDIATCTVRKHKRIATFHCRMVG